MFFSLYEKILDLKDHQFKLLIYQAYLNLLIIIITKLMIKLK